MLQIIVAKFTLESKGKVEKVLYLKGLNQIFTKEGEHLF